MVKPIRFKGIEVRKPRYDPHPEKSTTDNSDWRQGCFVIFEDYQGETLDWMPRYEELAFLIEAMAATERKNKALAYAIAKKDAEAAVNGQKLKEGV